MDFPINSKSSSRYAINNYILTNGLQLQVLAYDSIFRYQSGNAIDPVMRIKNMLPDHGATMRIFNSQFLKPIDWDPGKLVTTALCMIHHAQTGIGNPKHGIHQSPTS
ncbi:hypothetical protein BGZ47_009128 [Haplosporangium gracile]|nr:hypothetical protein BGZ47_009128 [Haplosporangium gracile]